jgi:hypothetical protein
MTVKVSGRAVAQGFSLEIEDRGLGMDAKGLVTANERLAAPEFDLSDSAQLGLFVEAPSTWSWTVSMLSLRYKTGELVQNSGVSEYFRCPVNIPH